MEFLADHGDDNFDEDEDDEGDDYGTPRGDEDDGGEFDQKPRPSSKAGGLSKRGKAAQEKSKLLNDKKKKVKLAFENAEDREFENELN